MKILRNKNSVSNEQLPLLQLGWWRGAGGKGHIKFWKDLTETWDLIPGDTDRTIACVGDRQFRVVTDSFAGSSKFLPPAQFNIFTDGSKTNSGVGSGVAVYKHTDLIHEEPFQLSRTCTVFQAEVNAVRQAADFLIRNQSVLGVSYVKIHCDSQVALLALNSREVRSTLVKDTIDALNRLALVC